MHQNKVIVMFLVLTLIVTSCIKSFTPNIDSGDLNKIVVTGQVNQGEVIQRVNISRSSPISYPEYLPIIGCSVEISDDKGNVFMLGDDGNGNYTGQIDQAYLQAGASFRIRIITPDGDEIVSDYDQINACPEIDTVYFERKDVELNTPGKYSLGIQFYVNLDARATASRYFMWEAFETWEYHADYPIEWWYDGVVHHVWPPDYSRKVCWKTRKIQHIYTLTTRNLTDNIFNRYELQYVDNLSARLMYGYSLLVKQYALSETAYTYWDQMRINSNQQGGLYEKQPLAIHGNLRNMTHPDNEVLGFFGAAAVRSTRIFVANVPDLPLDFSTYCSPSALRQGLREISPSDYPAYLMGNEFGYSLVQLNVECVDCLAQKGGTNIKPDFWPN